MMKRTYDLVDAERGRRVGYENGSKGEVGRWLGGFITKNLQHPPRLTLGRSGKKN